MLCLDLFNKYKFKLTVSVLGSGCRLAVLHPDSLYRDSLHGDSLHGDQVCDLGLCETTFLIPVGVKSCESK